MLRHLDLFSGIGGFALAARMVGGYETVAFCEIEPYCQAVLRKHWPRVPIYERVDYYRGLPLSRSISGWEASRALRLQELIAACADWLIVENVAHTWRRWVPELRLALHEHGYSSMPFRVRASDVGAPHERSRVFVVANANGQRLWHLSRWWDGEGREMASELRRTRDYGPGAARANDGIPARVDRNRGVGNAVHTGVAAIFLQAIKECEGVNG